MFCTNCGWQNDEGSAYCEKCGAPLESDIPVPKPAVEAKQAAQSLGPDIYPNAYPYSVPSVPAPLYPVYDPRPVQPAVRKKNNKLIAGLVAGGVLIIAAVILIVALSGGSPLAGTWYCEDRGVVLEFKSGGIVTSQTIDGDDAGNYSFDSKSRTGVIKADGDQYDFTLEGGRITVENIGTFKEAEKSFDVRDFLDRHQDHND